MHTFNQSRCLNYLSTRRKTVLILGTAHMKGEKQTQRHAKYCDAAENPLTHKVTVARGVPSVCYCSLGCKTQNTEICCYQKKGFPTVR